MTREDLLQLAKIYRHKNFGFIQVDARGASRRIPWDTAHDELVRVAVHCINEAQHRGQLSRELLGTPTGDPGL